MSRFSSRGSSTHPSTWSSGRTPRRSWCGFEVAFHGEYREIVPNERIVSTEVFEGAPVEDPEQAATVNTLTLTESDGRTTLEVLVQAPNKEVRDAIIDSGMEGGMQEAMDLLEQVAVSLR